MSHALDPLLNPRSVAIISASSYPSRIGGRPVHYLLEQGFAGAVYPVNPGREKIQGLLSYVSLLDIPGPVDCAVIAVPAADVATASGLHVPTLATPSQTELKVLIPQAGVRNPIDFTANAVNNPELM